MRPDTVPTVKYTALQGSYWACYCCVMTFSSVYLLDAGFSNAQIGLLISLAGILSALLQPLVSRLADGLKRLSLGQFTAFLAALQLFAALLLLFLPGRLSQLGLYGLLVILVQLVMPLCSALGMACINRGISLNFGAARGAGSISYGVVSALCGQLVLWFGVRSVPVSMAVLYLLLLISILVFRFRGEVPKAPAGSPKGPVQKAPFLRKYRHFIWLLAASFCLFISHNMLNTFAFQIVRPLGGDSGSMGTMLFVQSLAELPVMFTFSQMLKKAGSRVWLRLSGIGFFLHAFGAFLAPTMGWMFVVQIFELPGYAFYTLASIYYVNETVDEEQRVQGQAWFTTCTTLGSVIASLWGGYLLDWSGASALLAVASAAGAVGMVLFFLFLSPKARTMEKHNGT